MELYSLFLQHPVVSTDSRSVPPDSLFFALKGDTFDGNDFADHALRNGAAFVVMDDPGKIPDNRRCILVEDALKALQQLAVLHRKNLTQTTFLAITGSNGKTTTKELMAAVLKKAFHVQATQGNLNNHIGLPLTILSVEKNSRFAVVEMGANHPGEIAALCRIASPEYGIITNIGKAHLEGFGGLQGVIAAKSELYHYIRDNGGKIFLNNDNTLLRDLAEFNHTITYGFKTESYCSGRIIEANPMLRIGFSWQGAPYTIQTALTGSYNAENVLAAVCAGLWFGVEPKLICEAVEHFVPRDNRSQIIRTADNTLILDAYNANPSSMMASIENFSIFPAAAKILVLGDMLELGDTSEEEHRAVVAYASSLGFTAILLVGPQFCSAAKGLPLLHFETTDDLAGWLSNNPVRNSTLLLKGSRRMRLETVIKYL